MDSCIQEERVVVELASTSWRAVKGFDCFARVAFTALVGPMELT